MQYDLIIIGGGVVGSAIARELSRYRLKIGLLEKEAELAFGVSKSNSGIIHPGTKNPVNSLKGKLCVQGNSLVRNLTKELGLDFKRVGELVVILNSTEMPELIRLKQEAVELGVPGVEIVDQQWLKKNEPNLTGAAFAALYSPTAGIISPYRFTYALAENAEQNGVEIFTSTEVKNILKTDYFEIQTNRGKFYSRTVVNAAGLFADQIANLVGITDFKITARKGEEYLLDKKRENLVKHVLFPLPTPQSKGILVIKTSDGNPMIGPTAEDVPEKNDLTTTEQGLQKVLSSVKKLVPTIQEQDIIAYFAGLRPIAGKDFIIRAEKNIPGMFTVAGIQSPGLTAAPAIALMVAELLQQNGLELKKKFRFHRKRNKTFHLFAIPLSRTKKLIHKKAAYGDIVCRCEMVSAQEIQEAIKQGAHTLDGIKFRTRAQAGRCHGGFCTTRIMKIMAKELGLPVTRITKRGPGSEIVKASRMEQAGTGVKLNNE